MSDYANSEAASSSSSPTFSTLEVFLGPMGAGKTSELTRRARMLACSGTPILCIGHVKDLERRTDDGKSSIRTHDGATWPAVLTPSLITVIDTRDYRDAEYVLIDEAQFFGNELIEFLEIARGRDGKNVVLSALDATSEMKPFVDLVYLITNATTVIKMTGICRYCGRPAGHTVSLVEKTSDVMAGGFGEYAPCCYGHAKWILSKHPIPQERKSRRESTPRGTSPVIEMDANSRRLALASSSNAMPCDDGSRRDRSDDAKKNSGIDNRGFCEMRELAVACMFAFMLTQIVIWLLR